jgi:hypothetical protein
MRASKITLFETRRGSVGPLPDEIVSVVTNVAQNDYFEGRFVLCASQAKPCQHISPLLSINEGVPFRQSMPVRLGMRTVDCFPFRKTSPPPYHVKNSSRLRRLFQKVGDWKVCEAVQLPARPAELHLATDAHEWPVHTPTHRQRLQVGVNCAGWRAKRLH